MSITFIYLLYVFCFVLFYSFFFLFFFLVGEGELAVWKKG